MKYLVFIAKGKLLIDTIFYPCQFLLDSTFKGIVQLDVRGVKSRLRWSVLINYLVALVYFFSWKSHSCERSKNQFKYQLLLYWIELVGRIQNSCNDRLHTFNLKKPQITSYELWATLQATSFEIQVMSYELRSVTCKILPVLAYDSKVWYVDCYMIVRCIEFNSHCWFAPAAEYIIQVLYHKSIGGHR
jgi:hypothetical protein